MGDRPSEAKTTPEEQSDPYTVEPFPPMRRWAVDNGWLNRRRHIIHALMEMDITLPRQRIADYRQETGERISFTAFLIRCLAVAVSENPSVSAWKDWRGRLVIFHKVNISTMVEVEMEGKKVGMPLVFHDAGSLALPHIHAQIRQAQTQPRATGEARFMDWFLRLPALLRRWFYLIAVSHPRWSRALISPVMVTAVGMFGQGGGWGIPAATFPLTVTVGGIIRKPGLIEERIEPRQYLDITLSFDHDIIDGAPAARFTQRFRQLVECGFGLDELPTPGKTRVGKENQ